MKIKEIMNALFTDPGNRRTDRTRFNESFLGESPQRHPPANYIDNLADEINDYINNGEVKVFDLGNIAGYEFKKFDLNTVAYYWFEKNKEILLAVQLRKFTDSRQVQLRGSGKPYAVDLYLGILNDVGKNVTIMSDNQLTEKGLSLWKRLFDQGHKIVVYDVTSPGKIWKTLYSINELEKYFGDEESYKNYRYVLVESSFLNDTRSFFRLRTTRENSGSALTD